MRPSELFSIRKSWYMIIGLLGLFHFRKVEKNKEYDVYISFPMPSFKYTHIGRGPRQISVPSFVSGSLALLHCCRSQKQATLYFSESLQWQQFPGYTVHRSIYIIYTQTQHIICRSCTAIIIQLQRLTHPNVSESPSWATATAAAAALTAPASSIAGLSWSTSIFKE